MDQMIGLFGLFTRWGGTKKSPQPIRAEAMLYVVIRNRQGGRLLTIVQIPVKGPQPA